MKCPVCGNPEIIAGKCQNCMANEIDSLRAEVTKLKSSQHQLERLYPDLYKVSIDQISTDTSDDYLTVMDALDGDLKAKEAFCRLTGITYLPMTNNFGCPSAGTTAMRNINREKALAAGRLVDKIINQENTP